VGPARGVSGHRYRCVGRPVLPVGRRTGGRHDRRRAGKPRIGQQPLSYDIDADAALRRAHEQFRWFGGGWKINAELPGPTAFDAASSYVRPEDVGESIPCGSSVEDVVDACTPFVDAGFTHLALVQIGGDQQQPYFEWAQASLLPALREAFG
jgi:hypothetical protein